MMHHPRLLAALALALAPMAGCLGPADGSASGSIAFETIDVGQQSGIEDEETVVVRDQAGWEQLWQRHAPDDDRPAVDFDETMVAGVFKGQSPDGCHGAQITNVTTTSGDEVRVQASFFEVRNAYCTQQITYPFHIVAFERQDAEVTFDLSHETRSYNGTGPGANDSGEPSDGDEPGDDGSQDPGDGEPTGEGTYTCRDPAQGSDALTEDEQVPFDTVEDGQQSEIREACVTVAANETAWQELWADHGSAADARPSIDFDRSLVVAIFKGQSPDACHGAEIEEVTRDGEDLVVHGVFSRVEGQTCAEVLTFPYHIAEVERPEGEVVFDVREETREG